MRVRQLAAQWHEAEQMRITHLARLDRVPAQIDAVELEQVEGEQEDAGVRASIPETIERWQPVLTAGHCLAVEQEGADLERRGGVEDLRISLRPVVAVSGEQPDTGRIPPDHHAEAVIDLVNPARARRRALGPGWQAGLDEAGGHDAFC